MSKIISVVFLTLFFTSVFAAVQCPPKSGLTRSPGQNSTWVLSNQYVRQGWHEVGVSHTWEYPQPHMVDDLSDPRIQVTASAYFSKAAGYYVYRCDYEFTTPAVAPNIIPPVKLVAWAAVEYEDTATNVFDLNSHPGFEQKGNRYLCFIKQETDCQF